MRLDSQLSRINCQIVSTGLSSGDLGGRATMVMFAGTISLSVHMPSGPIHHEHGVRSGRDLGGDPIEMPLHATGIAAGQDQGGADTAFRAHGPKDAGGAGALILGCYRTCSSPGPASRAPSCHLVLLADPGFILPPQLYPGCRR